jgi:hypothetical protein
MDEYLFEKPKTMPKAIKKAKMYKTTEFRSFSSRERKFVTAFNGRVSALTKLLKLKERPNDMGDRLAFRESEYAVEVFSTSDSLWMTHNEVAFDVKSDKVPSKIKTTLPGKARAKELAAGHIKRLKLDTKHAKLGAITYDEEIKLAPGSRKQEVIRTAINVNYGFRLAGLDVFGPGAKIQVSLGDKGRLNELLCFWRKPAEDKTMDIISAEEALEKLAADPMFMRLSPENAAVKFETPQFGYYAMSPGEFQRYLIPVWSCAGVAKTRELPEHHFRYYVVAITLKNDEVKKLGIVADPSSCQIFS